MTILKKIPVLFLIDCLYGDGKGGSESQFRKAYQYADEMGVEPHVVFLRDQKIHDELTWTNKPLVVNLHSFSPLQARRAARQIESYLAHNRIEIIQSLFDDASIMACVLKIRQPRLNFICTQRNLGHSRGWFRRWIFRFIYQKADAVLVNSEAIQELLQSRYKVKDTKIKVIDNMHDISAAEVASEKDDIHNLRRSQRSMLGVVVANLRPIKGIGDLIAACNLLPCDSRLEFVLLGDGPERCRYEQMIADNRLSSRLQLLGYVDDVYSVLSRADFGVLPSRAEGGSNSLIEYMLSGLPVVATSVGGNKDFLCEGRFGVLVNPEDPVSLSFGLQEIENNYSRWSDAAQEGKAYARIRFSTPTNVTAHKSFYQEIAMSNGRNSA